MRDPREELAERIAGEVALSEDPGATLRKWREEFDVAQTTLADELDVSASVVSDYESGRRENPGIRVVRRVVEGLLAVDERRGGDRVRQHARVLSAGFDQDVVYDLREYAATVPLTRFYRTIDAEEITAGTADTVAGHTVINSVEAIKRLSSEEFYRLYGQSTNRALVFTDVTRGESPLVALRVVTPTPSAVVLHGIEPEGLWEHAPALARADGVSLATTTRPLEELLEALRELP
ncbi:helix-turn-helix domain-containing protein [Natronomonas salina]|uniref:helix-turn-helix domain-containing protein n=1 Tax=Natronomonas salina TaxID=1710540 RepID=UPI0015B6B6BD|nr:helix-turn-helix domain-containing protein [Natronomonas salina]QLD90892.1 helix-turn-helix domain-containing protein [Natronomonas salina]